MHSRSERHLAVQMALKERLPEIELERPFLSICRVADLFWEAQGLVFEIQCSPISELEVERRVRDYRALGLVVVWILDDRLYNKRRLKPAERQIRRGLSYFASVEKESLAVEIYDQLEFLTEEARRFRGRRLAVDFTKGRFQGDRNDPAVQEREAETLRRIAGLERAFLKKERLRVVREPLQQGYLGVFDALMAWIEP